MTATSTNTAVDPQLSHLVRDAYDLEAERLDDHDLHAWATWLHPEFAYEVPVGVIREDPREPQHSAVGMLAMETRSSIDLWLVRMTDLLRDVAYSENPPVRTRHFISGVRVRRQSDGTLAARSNILLTWLRADEPPQFVAGERHDVLTYDDDGQLLLRHRRVLLDATVLYLTHLRVIL
jgi:3-phenylpropionate/cinnamic acid dioxygenase small subunit